MGGNGESTPCELSCGSGLKPVSPEMLTSPGSSGDCGGKNEPGGSRSRQLCSRPGAPLGRATWVGPICGGKFCAGSCGYNSAVVVLGFLLCGLREHDGLSVFLRLNTLANCHVERMVDF